MLCLIVVIPVEPHFPLLPSRTVELLNVWDSDSGVLLGPTVSRQQAFLGEIFYGEDLPFTVATHDSYSCTSTPFMQKKRRPRPFLSGKKLGLHCSIFQIGPFSLKVMCLKQNGNSSTTISTPSIPPDRSAFLPQSRQGLID